MEFDNYKIIQDPIYGYKHLDPIPTQADLNKFYKSQYYELARKGGRAPEIRRLTEGGQVGERELNWLKANLYTDISYYLNKISPGKNVLDAGCGRGDFVSFLNKQGFQATGIDIATDAIAIAQEAGLPCYEITTEKFISNHNSKNLDLFDAITLLNVIEHVPDPALTIRSIQKILKPDGVICIRVPNDFTDLQMTAQKKLKKEPWWIAIPDHINYFNISSLCFLLNRLGFEVVDTQTDFPMEFFLLMGYDYVENPVIGNECHNRRMNFEMSIPPELRRKIYKALAGVGVGRGILIFAKKV